MRSKRLFAAIGNIDGKFISEDAEDISAIKHGKAKQASRRAPWVKFAVPLAACLVIAVGILIGQNGMFAPHNDGDNVFDILFPQTTESSPVTESDNSSQTPSLQFQLLSADLMTGFTAEPVQGRAADERFISAVADFSVKLFKRGITDGENSLVSPLSVLLALSMTGNGAAADTLWEMENTVGRGISVDEMNEYLLQYLRELLNTDEASPAVPPARCGVADALPRLSIANSIWFRDDGLLTVEADFLQKNANFYGAAAYKSDFNAPQTVDVINAWVEANTDEMIDRIIEEIDPLTVMYLINAIAFDALWENPYNSDYDVRQRDFSAWDGRAVFTDFLHSDEYGYILSDDARGFIKPYMGGQYAFVALLPDEGIRIEDYVQSLTGETLMGMLQGASQDKVATAMPKFSYEYSISLNDALKEMGMPLAFDENRADFSRLGQSPYGNLYIAEVLHKTFIEVTESGTRAGAVTAVEIRAEDGPVDRIILDRPFVYAIVDVNTNLPIFIGTVLSVG